ncbi:MAG: DnaJ C-terminal domain-containing protein [Pirellulaceae bacterium]
MAQDYYAILGVGRSASKEEIQKAYRQLARKYHPDLNPDDKVAQQKFKDIQQAHDVLSDPEKRKMYDQFGPDFEKVGAGGGNPFGGSAGGAGFSFEDLFGGGGRAGGFDGDLGDIFRQFGGGGAGGGGRARQQAPAKGRDLTAEITIPFQTSVMGGEASISVQRGGANESISVKIPPGIETGKKMRLRGQGEAGPRGDAGDLIVEVSVAPHPCFRRSSRNLEVTLPVTLSEATLGAKIDVPTPGGTVALKVPPGTSSGRRLRVKGQGVRSPNGQDGDLYVEIEIRIPESLSDSEQLTPEQRQVIEGFDSMYSTPVREKLVW